MLDRKIIKPNTREDLREWLTRCHDQREGVYVRVYKKQSGRRQFTTSDVTEECLCFGWIDSVPARGNADYFLLYISPRKPKSVWSAANKRIVDRLIQEERMHPSGLKAVEKARSNGAWDALSMSDRLELPPELEQQLNRIPKALTFFNSLTDSNKRMILEWIYAAKRPETQSKRIQETVEKAARGLRVRG